MATIQSNLYDGARGVDLDVWEVETDITNNRKKYGWRMYGYGGNSSWYQAGNFYAAVGGQQVYYSASRIHLYNGTIIAQGEIWLGHNSDGSKWVDMYCEAGVYNVAVNCRANGGFWATLIPRQANVTGANNFNSDQNPYLTFTNPAGYSLKAKLELGVTEIIRDNIPNTGNYTFVLTETERNLLYSKCPNSNTLSVRYTIVTKVNGTDTWWQWLDRTMTVVNSNPTYDAIGLSYKDSNTNIVAITGNDQHIVRNNSNLKVTFGVATAKNYASISKYEVIFNGITTIKAVGTIDLGVVNAANDLILSIKATDTRGNSTTIQRPVKILDWVNPAAINSANRVNNFENIVKLKVDVTISSVNSKNAIKSIIYRCKKTTDTNFSADKTASNNTVVDVSVDNKFAWNFQVIVADKFGNTTYNFVIAKGMPIMFFDIDKLSVAINGFPTKKNSFESHCPMYNASGNEILDYDVIDTW